MSCYACKSPEVVSVHENIYAGKDIRYLAHKGTGIQIIKCRQCGFMSVEFVHPKITDLIYRNPPPSLVTLDASVRANLHQGNCKNQLETWQQYLPENCGRLLFWGAGRAKHATDYLPHASEVFACDLIPEQNKLIATNTPLKAIEANDLTRSDLEGSFDVIILSNVLERMAFPQSQLRLCARLLKAGGTLFLEVPDMNYDLVRTGQYGPEEINFFSIESLEAMVSGEGNLILQTRTETEEPSALKNASDAWSDGNEEPASQKRAVIRMVLQNQRAQIDTPQPDILPQDIGAHILKLSMACMMHSLSLARYSDEMDPQPRKTPSVDYNDH